ncbi:MAG: zf-HC2 domain-containing protein [Thermodesulfobacteriota bacterium]|jgi:predicted anti-sigma-YlaC factor YlaD
MKDICSSVSKLLEKYFDQEVTGEERSLVENHLHACPSCRQALKAMEGLRHLIKSPMEDAAKEEDFYWVWQRIERETRPRERLTWKESILRWLDISAILRRKVWVPAVVTMAILILIAVPFVFKEISFSSTASVVEYVESQSFNVMIYESDKGNVTVIWLLEGPEQEGSLPTS